MSDSRARILASVRKSLAGARHLPVPPALTPLALPEHEDTEQLLARFGRELAALDGVLLCETPLSVAGRIAVLAHERGASNLLVWDEEGLPVPGLHEALRQEGLGVLGAELPHREPDRSQELARAERLTVGVTGVLAALADNGSLVLRAGPGRPRLASLSVRTHVALFTPQQLHASLAAWWSSGAAETLGNASNLTLITGPSRTGDIEMTLTVGVHGPAELIAIAVV